MRKSETPFPHFILSLYKSLPEICVPDLYRPRFLTVTTSTFFPYDLFIVVY